MKKLILIFILITSLFATAEYRKFTLENEMKVMLVSDEKYNKSAASMNVMVGSLSDPKEYQGLAHFLEHMLFLGTEKYPNVEDYGAYLQSNGGYSNAYTAEDHTNYHFEVYHDAFEGALDRFSQFFISPIFSEEYTQREMNAVNSEYQKNLEQDYWRMRQVKRGIYNESHPANHFEIGTLETLTNVNRDVLLDFHKRYYSSNQMCLSILSNKSLDELESLVRTYFVEVKNTNAESIKFAPAYFPEEDKLRLLKVIPVKDVKRLVLEFPTPSFYSHYLTKPENLISYIIGHEGEGSLLAYLKSKGYATGIGGWGSSATKDYGNFNIWVELTSDGFNEYEEILISVFSYIEMIKAEGYQSFIFSESKVLAELEEQYSDKGEGAGVAVGLANNLAFYPMEDAERIKYIFEVEDASLYSDLLSFIRPDNMLATLSGYEVETDSVEPWYSAKYSYSKGYNDLYKQLKSPPNIEELKLPTANPFMPTSTGIYNLKNGNEIELIQNSGGLKLYHSRDSDFNRPKASLKYKVNFSNKINSLENAVLMDLYISAVNESLNEIGYPAYLAGMEYTITNSVEGINIAVSGYDSALERLLDVIIKNIKHVNISEKHYSVIVDATKRKLENSSLDDAYKIARRNSAEITNQTFYSPEKKLTILEDFTLADIKSFPKKMFKGVYIEGFAHGNITKRDALKLSTKVRNSFGFKSLRGNQVFEQKRLVLDNGEDVRRVIHSKVNNSAYVAMADIGGNTPKDRVMALLIDTFLGQPYYMELRTNQQLGYIVAAGAYSRNDYSGLYFIIQSDGYGADEVERRSLTFLDGIGKMLSELTIDDYNVYKNAVKEIINEKSTSILEECNKRFTWAFELNEQFNRDDQSLEAADAITFDGFKAKVNHLFEKVNQKKVSVLLFAEQHEIPKNVEATFEDVVNWKKSRMYE
jgi:insulysin